VFNYIKAVVNSSGLSLGYIFPMAVEASGNASAVDAALFALSTAPANVSAWIIAGECVPLGYFTAQSKPLFKPLYVKIPLNSTLELAGPNTTYIGGRPAQIILPHGIEVWLPAGLQWIYDELPLFGRGLVGQGVTIGIVDAFGDVNFTLANSLVYSDTAANDLALFDRLFGLPNPPSFRVVYPLGTPILTPYNLGDSIGWSYETALDIEYAHTMAPGANIVLAVSPDAGDDLFLAVEYLTANKMADFISLSWGAFEDMYLAPPPTPQLLYAYDEVFKQAAAEGIGVFAASGDSGAFDIYWQYFGLPIEPSVLYPASDPWVTGVGGTTLHAYIADGQVARIESAWNWNARYMWGSGGGYSLIFAETPGQALANIAYERPVVLEPTLSALYNTTWLFWTVGHRGVPDIAADADPYTGVLLVVNGSLSPYLWGGTSLATPLSAGMAAVIQSGLGQRLGDLAPNLYLLYSREYAEFYSWGTTYPASAFTSGVPGGLFATQGGQNGLYNVIMGEWNPVDGLGQINVFGLYNLLFNSQ
jgi:subtilase family serine protease